MTTLSMITTIIVALITAVIGPLIVTWVQAKLANKTQYREIESAHPKVIDRPKVSQVSAKVDKRRLIQGKWRQPNVS